MDKFLPISVLNDFIFCPYSIYLRQVYSINHEEVYHAKYQSRGKRLHGFIDNDQDENGWKNAFVFSLLLGIYGKIDSYNQQDRELIEYKSRTAIIFRGYYYQIWAQYLCLIEMGLVVDKLAIYDLSTQQKQYIPIPSNAQVAELKQHIQTVRYFDFTTQIPTTPNKCSKCIYHNLCERKP